VELNTVKSRTLERRRIIITRAPEQSKELVGRLEELGAEAVMLPVVRFLEPDNTVELDQAVQSLETFDWLIFTSANAVRFFLGRCRTMECWPAVDGRGPKIAVVGSATQLALAKEGLQSSLVPREFSGTGLATELRGVVAKKSVLLPRSDRATEDLPELLRNAGAKVTEVIAYRTTGPESFDPGMIEAIRAGLLDAVTFFSPSAFREFQNLLGAEVLAKWDSRVAFAAVGPVTAEAIRAANLPVAIEAEEATTASLIEGLENYFATANETGDRKRENGRDS
jgi:uroporphyrinogen-III synthase